MLSLCFSLCVSLPPRLSFANIFSFILSMHQALGRIHVDTIQIIGHIHVWQHGSHIVTMWACWRCPFSLSFCSINIHHLILGREEGRTQRRWLYCGPKDPEQPYIIRWRSYWAIVTFYAVWSIDGDWRREAVRNRQANDWSTQRNRQTLMKGRYIHREGSTCTHTKKRMKKEIKTNRKNEEEDFKVEKQNNLYLLDVGGTCRSKFEFLTSQLGMCTTLAYSRETHIRRKSGYHQVRDGNVFARQRRRGPRCMWLAADGLAASLRAVATCIIYA